MKRYVTKFMAVVAMVLGLANAVSAQGKDVVDTAVAAGQFKTLAAALQAAGLVDTLKGKGPFTVFAPTDAAFAKLPKGTAVVAMVLGLANAVSAQGKDVVDTAVAAGQFKTLAAALQAAGLVDTLKGKGRFIVFAPTGAAFAKLTKGTAVVAMVLGLANAVSAQ